jgi:hypothetical protein
MISDIISYLIGLLKGASNVILEGGDYEFSDPNHDGNIVVTKKEEDE